MSDETTPRTRRTGRVVAADGRGWYLAGDDLWHAPRYGETATWEELQESHGPLRPVESPTEADIEPVRRALREAGTAALSTLAVTLHRILRRHGEDRMRAGRPGSWEATFIIDLAQLGGRIVTESVPQEPLSVLVETVDDWITRPERMIEVAANLIDAFGTVSEELGGWDKVSDGPWQGRGTPKLPADVIDMVRTQLMPL